MSNYLSADQTIELIESLKASVQACAAREADLEKQQSTKLGALSQQKQAALESIAAKLETDLQEAGTANTAAEARAHAAYDRRRTRIGEAWKASKEQALNRIESQEGRRKYKLQTETMHAAKARKEGLAAAEKAYEDFKTELAAENETLTALEQSAQNAFQGYRKFRNLLSACENADPDLAPDEYELIKKLRESREQGQRDLERFRSFALPRLFKHWPFLAVGVFVQFGAVPVLESFKINGFGYLQAAESVGGLLLLGLGLHALSKQKSLPAATEIARALVKARKLHDACADKTETRHTRELERIEAESQAKNQAITAEWGQALDESEQLRQPWLKKVDQKHARICAKADQAYRARMEKLQQENASRLEQLQDEANARKAEFSHSIDQRVSSLKTEFEAQHHALVSEWNSKIVPLYEKLTSAGAQSEAHVPPWTQQFLKSWTPPSEFSHVTRIANLELDVEKMVDALPRDKRLALPGPSRFETPLLLKYPEQGSVLFETSEVDNDSIVGALNNVMLRLLTKAPPGRFTFTIFDPVGLGQNFAGIMHLADYEEHLINSRIWTQPSQIDQKLADLNEHMEKVIQMYLRNEYATIAEYNKQAGNIAEKYHFLVVANFPAGFTEAAIKRLLSIAASGARCGVYTLIHWDHRQPLAQEFVPDELKRSSVCITARGNKFFLAGKSFAGVNLLLDSAPKPEFAIEMINKIGRSSRDSNRVEVPFSHVTPADSALWSQDNTTELRVALGRAGATKLQYLAIGKGTRQHALIAGKTGSGKSTLFHVIITNLALWCSPEQVEFYLVDFKKGVEFKCYAANRLPHARVVAIESDREFGLSVLQRVDAELKRRGDLFRKLGVQDIAGYKRAGGTEPIPRSLLLIDEFQEFFVEDDKVSQTASLLLDRIVRQGRAFGIHVILGSQTLGGAYTMARTTLGQMVIRIALQCNEADSYLIMDENNAAPRLLSRPGEGIYNDAAGALEGNSPFQTVWLPDDVRETYLRKVRAHADKAAVAYSGPIVFEGDAPADVAENPLLRQVLEAPAIKPVAVAHAWLGAPNSIKGPTEALFQKQSGSHLLTIGQREESVLAIFSTALIALAAQYPQGAARFIIVEATAPGSSQREYLERVTRMIPHDVIIAKNSDLPDVIGRLAADIKDRADDTLAVPAPTTFIFIHELQKFTRLRYEEDFAYASSESLAGNPAVALNSVICEGASRGVHVFATCDSYNNVTRFLSRKAVSEFGMRVLFQMSANDSAALIDSPRASTLGLHRALFYNEREGYLEVFRPYALPSSAWLENAESNLKRLVG